MLREQVINFEVPLPHRRVQLQGVAKQPPQKNDQVCPMQEVRARNASPEQRCRNCQKAGKPEAAAERGCELSSTPSGTFAVGQRAGAIPLPLELMYIRQIEL